MDKRQLKILINSREESLLKKLKYAGLNKLEYWEKRPENLSRAIFKIYLKNIDETRRVDVKISPRESNNGKYGKTGFKWVFKFEDTIKIVGKDIPVYVKGFFFEKGNPIGVEIQSFKRSKRLRVLRK